MTRLRRLAGKLLRTGRGSIRPLSSTSPRVPASGGVSGYFFPAGILALALAGGLSAQSVFEAPLAAFAQKAAAASMAEVELGRVGVRKAADGRVQRFAARMVEDHSRAGARLREAAESDGIRLPTGPDLSHAKVLEALNAAAGPAFDRRFMDQMVEDHEAAVAEYEKAAEADGECPVRAFARGLLPTLRAHLETARRIRTSLGAGSP